MIRRDLQRLAKNGSSSCVNIRGAVMRHLGWLTGMSLIVEVLDDDTVVVRKPTIEDLGPQVPRARQLAIPVEVKA